MSRRLVRLLTITADVVVSDEGGIALAVNRVPTDDRLQPASSGATNRR